MRLTRVCSADVATDSLSADDAVRG